ncbi:MAG: hypothetical protein Q9166_002570 [cf. Caloplaca sp. 2 TL-2023]
MTTTSQKSVSLEGRDCKEIDQRDSVKQQEQLGAIGQRIRATFEALATEITRCQRQDPLAIDLQNAAQRYNLWAINLGLYTAGHSSLEYRLGDAPSVYDYARHALADLEKYLDIVVQAFQDTREDRDSSSETLKQDKIPDTLDRAQAEVSDDSEDEDFETYDDESVANTALGNVCGIIDRLYRLSFKIRNPATRVGFTKAQRYQEIDGETGVDLIEAFAVFDRQHIEQVFIQLRENQSVKKAAESDDEDDDEDEEESMFEMSETKLQEHYLVKRLARANTRRRQQFKQWRHHRNKVEASSRQVKEFDPLIRFSKAPETSQKEFLKVVPTPDKPAPSIPSTATRVNQANIDLDDTRSIVSTSTYARIARTCKEHPGVIFGNLENWQEHVASQHLDDSVATDLETIKADLNQSDKNRRCPICTEANVTDEHVGIHLQQIALFALPRSTGLEDDLDLDVNASAAAVDDLERDREDDLENLSFSDKERPPEAVYGIDFHNVGNMLVDLDPYELAPNKRHINEDDWSVVYNPNLSRELDIELIHSTFLDSSVFCVKFSYDGRFLAIGLTGSAAVYETSTWAEIFTLPHGSGDHASGERFPYSKNIGALAYTLSGHQQAMCSIDFMPDSGRLLSGSADRTVRLWNVEAVSEELNLVATDIVYDADISSDGHLLAAGLKDSSAMIWNRQGTAIATLSGAEGHSDGVYCIAFAPDSHKVVTGSFDKTCKLWDLQDAREPLRTFTGHKESVLSVAFTRDGRWIMSGSRDKGIQFWNPDTGEAVLRINGIGVYHQRAYSDGIASVSQLDTSPAENHFATVSFDGLLKVWRSVIFLIPFPSETEAKSPRYRRYRSTTAEFQVNVAVQRLSPISRKAGI